MEADELPCILESKGVSYYCNGQGWKKIKSPLVINVIGMLESKTPESYMPVLFLITYIKKI
jgi:hypothetical protein